jgi:hypothetical protein
MHHHGVYPSDCKMETAKQMGIIKIYYQDEPSWLQNVRPEIKELEHALMCTEDVW